MKLDPFIEAEKIAGHSVTKTCGLFEVSRSAYYERTNGVPSDRQVGDAELTSQILAIHAESKGTYGSPRIHQELGHRGVVCGRRRVAKLMRIAGLEGRCKKRWRKTTVADPEAGAAKDLIQRHFGPCEEIDRRYVGDITYIATWEGWAYLATVIDLASRKVVDNAVAESFFATSKRELIDTRSWPTGAGLHRAVFEYIEGWYNTRRLHSTLGYLSPNQYEMLQHNADRQAA